MSPSLFSVRVIQKPSSMDILGLTTHAFPDGQLCRYKRWPSLSQVQISTLGLFLRALLVRFDSGADYDELVKQVKPERRAQ